MTPPPPPPTRLQTAIVLMTGLGGGITASLQPMLLGALEHQGRINAIQLGQLSTAELAAMGLSSAIASAWFRPEHLRRISATAAVVAIAANIGTAFAPLPALFALRIGAGLCGGIMIWILVGLIARVAMPTRLSAAYILLQTTTNFTIATILSQVMIPRWGAAGGYACLAVVGCIILAGSLLLPDAYRASHGPGIRPPVRRAGWAGLLFVTALLAANTAIWIYSGPLAEQFTISRADARVVQTAAIGFQMVGGAVALLVARRVAALPILLIACAGNLAAAVTLWTGPSLAVFACSYAVLGFLWMLSVPFVFPYLLTVDPGGRAAMLSASAQIAGNAGGPLIASFMISGADIRPVLVTGAVFYIAALVLLAATRAFDRRRSTYEGAVS